MINRSKDSSGFWTYEDPFENEFVAWVELGQRTSYDYDYSSGVEMPWRHSLLSMDGFIAGDERPLTAEEHDHLMHLRGKAFEAYQAGNYDLQDDRIGVLQSECRRLGQLPLAVIGAKSANGYKKRSDVEDKADFIRLVRAVPLPLPGTMREWLALPQLAPYERLYKGRDTLRGWVKEAVPDVLKTGRPKKGTVTG